jgi:hypothetical protein
MMITTSTSTIPKFSQNQQVCFIGGVGKIRNCRVESGGWLYVVKMPLESEINLRRVGSEATILLYETEISSDSAELFHSLNR